MDFKIVEENICHELNKILHMCEIENKRKNENIDDEKNKGSQSDDPKLKFYHYFSISTRELMAANLGINSERQLRRYYENPLKILNNFELCEKIAQYQNISYIEMMARLLGQKTISNNYRSSLLNSIKLAEERVSKEARRKLAKLILVILENDINIDCFYDNTLFLIAKNQYKRESINKIKQFLTD